jgi:hypothetical protein
MMDSTLIIFLVGWIVVHYSLIIIIKWTAFPISSSPASLIRLLTLQSPLLLTTLKSSLLANPTLKGTSDDFG